MLLAVDVGNSETKLGFFARGRRGSAGPLLRHWRVTTERRRTADEFGVLFASLFRGAEIPLGDVRAVVVSSVVPQLDRAIGEACLQCFGVGPAFFTAATQEMIAVETERPKELGSDVLAGAISARAAYGTPLVVIGFGTATTFGAVGRGGTFLGAAIAPGIQTSIDALVERTAKLPQVALEAPTSVIGRDTVAALQSGIIYGFAGQCESLIARMRTELGADARVVATGGLAEIVARQTEMIDAVEPHLVLDGLRLYYDAALAPRTADSLLESVAGHDG
jgi:type III pantothenate kinase